MELHDLPDVELVHLDHRFSDPHNLLITAAFVPTSSVVAPFVETALSAWRRDGLFGFAAAPYQPVDTIANYEKRKASAGDGTGRGVIMPTVVVVPSLMVMSKCR
jgi:hypothetical protein